ncbi:MAG: DUF58 domain-containing protein [Provencibacterium sp.]|jgi:uncharacterized protein (DUF58 family)|nr:DUF58 domain-containing protein [Provencibacterium sp.]
MELIALLVIAAAIVYGQNFLFSHFALKRLEYRCSLSASEAVEGDEIELIETIENRRWLPAPWLKSEITTSRWLDFAGSQSAVTDETRFVPSFFMVRGYQRVERRWKVRCLKRGEYRIEKITLVSTDLFGNLSISKPVEADAHLLVLPRPSGPLPDLLSPRYLQGDRAAPRHLLPDPFFRTGAREWDDRDPSGRIHWGATAKTGRLMVYENEYTSRQNLGVILNMQSRPFENAGVIDREKIEEAIRLCAAAFEKALLSLFPLRFFTNANTTEGYEPTITAENWGEDYTDSLMRTLAYLQNRSTESFPAFLNRLSGRMMVSDVLIITAYADESLAQFVEEQARLGIHTQVLLVDFAPPEGLELGCPLLLFAPEGGEER